MKFHWGTYIAIFYTLFVAVMILMVIKSAQNKVHLVQDNYYDKDLNYESFRHSRQNAAELEEAVRIELLAEEKSIRITFPPEMEEIKGELMLFRPSNKFLDQIYPLLLDEEQHMTLSTVQMPPGKWRIKIKWESEEEHYYQEQILVL